MRQNVLFALEIGHLSCEPICRGCLLCHLPPVLQQGRAVGIVVETGNVVAIGTGPSQFGLQFQVEVGLQGIGLQLQEPARHHCRQRIHGWRRRVESGAIGLAMEPGQQLVGVELAQSPGADQPGATPQLGQAAVVLCQCLGARGWLAPLTPETENGIRSVVEQQVDRHLTVGGRWPQARYPQALF